MEVWADLLAARTRCSPGRNNDDFFSDPAYRCKDRTPGLMDKASKFESKEGRLESHDATAVKWIGGWGADLLSLAGLLAEGAESVQR